MSKLRDNNKYDMNIVSIITEIKRLYIQLTINSKLYKKGHNRLRDLICELAQHFGCKGKTEFYINNLGNSGRNGLVDVIWSKDGKLVCAFEIDSSKRKESIQKLFATGAENLFWIYYGQRFHNIKSFVENFDPENKIFKVFCHQKASLYI